MKVRWFLFGAVLWATIAIRGSAADASARRPYILYIPHIALASNCSGGYVNAAGQLADAYDPSPSTRGIRLRCGWESEVRVRNKSAQALHIRMKLHSSDCQPFRVAYQPLRGLEIHDIDSERDSLEFDLAPLHDTGYTFSTYQPWEPSWSKRVLGEWAEKIFGASLSPQTRNAWMTIEVAPGGPDSSPTQPIETTVTYRFRENGRIAAQAVSGTVVPASTFSYDFRSQTSRNFSWADTGLVVANPNEATVKVAISIRDKSGRDRGVTTIRLKGKEQLAAMLGILMHFNQPMEGRLTLASDSGPIVAIALQQAGDRSQISKIEMQPLQPIGPELN